MLDNWLSPLKKVELITKDFPPEGLGASILRHTPQAGMPNLKDIQIGLIGLQPRVADPIRHQFYAFQTIH